MIEYDYTKTPVAVDKLIVEIGASAIITALDHINLFGSALAIFFKADLSSDDKTILDAVVAAHDGIPLPENTSQNVSIISQPSLAIIASPPYSSKTIVVSGITHKLFTRLTGFKQQIQVGTNTITYVATYPWAKMLGVEAVNCEALDSADFKVFDDAKGTYSGTPNALLNQFAYAANLPKDYYIRMAQFDADLYEGMTVQITYTSISAKTIGINLLLNEVK